MRSYLGTVLVRVLLCVTMKKNGYSITISFHHLVMHDTKQIVSLFLTLMNSLNNLI